MKRSRPGSRQGRIDSGRAAPAKPAVRLAIVGAGRAGTALALALVQGGWQIGAVAARRLASARALARRCGAGLATTDAAEAARGARVLILAVPDRVLPELARSLAKTAGPVGGRKGAFIALHTSGASDASALALLQARGWAVGSLHPLLSFPKAAHVRAGTGARRGPGSPFVGAWFAIDGDPAARRLARRLTASLGAHPLAIPAIQRARYHLAACFAANYVVTLVWEATRLLEEAGVPRGRTLEALLPLIRSTVANLASAGLPDALTGPVARGDDVTLARHAAILRRGDRQRRELHRRLVERTARLAHEAGDLDRAALRRIERALQG
jgi:predicted short-subunit dehydrogenase-like oxidoreductase (DUF2520 family)